MGTTVLALVIGVTAGLLVRRSVAAMAVTLVAVVAVQILLPSVVQTHLMAPKQLTATITQERLTEVTGRPDPGPNGIVVERLEVSIDSPGAWITYNRTVDSSGDVVETYPSWIGECASPPGQTNTESQACFDRLAAEGYRQRVEYLPCVAVLDAPGRSRPGPAVGPAALLTGFCFWRIRRDLVTAEM